MEAVWRPLAIAVLLVATAAVGTLLLTGGEDEPATGPPLTATQEAVAQPAGRVVPDHTLVLPDRGNRVVYVLRGQQADLRSAPGGAVIRTVGDETEFGSPHVFAVARVEGNWVGVRTPAVDNGALAWVRLDSRDLGAGYTQYEVVVDLSDRRAELLEKGEVVRAFTVSVGAPGTTTPTGRFAVTDTFRQGLNPTYGCCAVALTARQPNLPSGWLGGNRIAIHATSGPLGAAISSGCVRGADRDVSALINKAPLGTPVTVRE
jgi:hypothetical protein